MSGNRSRASLIHGCTSRRYFCAWGPLGFLVYVSTPTLYAPIKASGVGSMPAACNFSLMYRSSAAAYCMLHGLDLPSYGGQVY